ncbi:MAG: hypothetical protein Q9166_007818, partial [cf. Caloplaca sp. 2 TL-2023]
GSIQDHLGIQSIPLVPVDAWTATEPQRELQYVDEGEAIVGAIDGSDVDSIAISRIGNQSDAGNLVLKNSVISQKKIQSSDSFLPHESHWPGTEDSVNGEQEESLERHRLQRFCAAMTQLFSSRIPRIWIYTRVRADDEAEQAGEVMLRMKIKDFTGILSPCGMVQTPSQPLLYTR